VKTKHIVTAALAIIAGFSSIHAGTGEKFNQDREAILSMAGAFEVRFHFSESFPIAAGYELRKPYDESARELVKLVSDTGERIVLQHLLVVGTETETTVVKHWGQVWTYQDTSILGYMGGERWDARKKATADVAGKWSQYVTQTDDSPRYESIGSWSHTGGASEWVSETTARPLPRREYSTRDDYQILMAENRHVVTKNGWSHFQNNRKRVLTGESHSDLCIEIGVNTYTRISPAPLAAAETWWAEHRAFWEPVAVAWMDATDKAEGIELNPADGRKTYARLIKDLRRKAGNTPAAPHEIAGLLEAFTINN
jgi:hypothetical protein